MKLDRFEIIIHGSVQMNSPQEVAHKLIALGKLMLTNQTFIKNCKENGGNGAIVDTNNDTIGKWIYVVEKEK